MKTEAEPKIPSLLVGVGVGAVGALIAALLARKETREKVLERGAKSLDYLKEQGQKLRERSKEAVEKGKTLMDCQCHESVQSSAQDNGQASEEKKREGMGC
jgi:gas vesicle protein